MDSKFDHERVLKIGRSRFSLVSYRIYSWVMRTFAYRYFRLEHVGASHLNREGQMIVAPVHRSNLDVPLVAPLSRRHIRSLAKDSMFKGPVSARFSASIGAVPVKRGEVDRQALHILQDLLLEGEAVLVFPEGTRQKGKDVDYLFDGCAYLAAKCKAPVVPVGIAGTGKAMGQGTKIPKRAKVVICVGEPIWFSSEAENRISARREFTEQLRRSLQGLMDEAHELAR